MRKRPVSRRRFLATAGAGSAALALGTGQPSAATALTQAQGAGNVTPPFVGQLAEYSGFPLAPDQAGLVTGLLGGTLAVVRGLRPPGYDNLEPAAIFRVPAEG